jgi:hypothetical protein
MDYSANASHLAKWQWDIIQNPAVFAGLTDKDEEGMLKSGKTKYICISGEISQKIQTRKYVLAPDGKYFELPSNYRVIAITYEDNSKNPAPTGSIIQFKDDNGILYSTCYDISSGTFSGYIKSGFDCDKNYKLNFTFVTNKENEAAKITIDKNNCTATVDGVNFTLSKENCDCADVKLNKLGQEIFDTNALWIPNTDHDILTAIAAIAQDFDIDIYNSFVTKQKHNGALFWNYSNRPTDYSRENLTNTLEQFKKYQAALEKLYTGSFASCDELVKHVVDNFQITKGSNNILIFPSDPKYTSIIVAPFKSLPLARKKQLTDILHNCSYSELQQIGNDVDAGTILAAIFKTSNEKSKSADADAKSLLDYIVQKNYLRHFVEDLYGVQYEGFMNALLNMALKNYDYSKYKIGNPESSPNYLKFSPAYLQLNSEKILNNSDIQLEVKRWFGENKYTVTGNAYAPVAVEFAKDVSFGRNTFKAGDRKVLPMIWAYQLFWKDTKAARWKTAQITAEVGLTVLGIGEITAAVRLYRAGQTTRATFLAVKALGDIGVGFTDIYLQNSDALTDAQIEKWNKFVLLYAVGSFSASAADGLVQKLGKKTINSSDDFAKIESEIDNLTDDGYKKLSQAEQDEFDNLINFAGADDLLRLKIFTQQQIDDYVKLATKNGDKNKVMLGMWEGDNIPTSYQNRAKAEGCTYFELDNWKEIEVLVNKNEEELWKINKQFIDNQKALNKEFYFSHNPWNYPTDKFRSLEAEYLIDLGAKDFIQINENTWKAIW